jgi:TPR repeat protein
MTFLGTANEAQCIKESPALHCPSEAKLPMLSQRTAGRGPQAAVVPMEVFVNHGHYKHRVKNVAFCIALFVLPVLAVWAQAASPNSTTQCSLAVVSKLLANSGKACDTETILRLAQQGQVYQQNQLGIASALALGPDYNTNEALKWFQKAALNGYAPAQVNLAVMYANGWGTPRNYGAAFEWLKAASEQHYARADYNLGLLYMQGTGVRRDYGEAHRWFQRSADGGDSWAQTNLGYLFDQGWGVARNAASAAFWYSKAAHAGNALGQYNLGDMYLRGEGVAQSDTEAVRWFQEAADQGQTGARIKLAYMYAQGRGTKRDLEYAYVLLTAASEAGDKRGNELLLSLERVLSPSQLVTAKSRAARLQSTQSDFSRRSTLSP